MRNSFINALVRWAQEEKEDFYFLTGDLGYGVLDPLKETLKDRFINMGVAEQLMAGFAAGLALNGKKVFIYSIANFPTFRCAEQIRNDICYHNLDVKIVSVGAGLSYGSHGYTHYGLEDLSLMRSLQNIEVLCPCDKWEAIAAADYSMKTKGPAYFRLGKNGEPDVHTEDVDLSKTGFLNDAPMNSDYYVLSTGSITFHAKQAVKNLQAQGLSIQLISIPFVHSLDKELLETLVRSKKVFTVEEHFGSGGFGSMVLESLSDWGESPNKVHRFFLPQEIKEIGRQEYLLKTLQMDGSGLAQRMQDIIQDKYAQ